MFEDEVRRRKQDLDILHQNSLALAERGAGPVVEPELRRLNQRWLDINSQLAQFKQTPHSPPGGQSAENGGLDSPDNTITRTTYNVVTTSVSRTTSSAKSPGQFADEVLRLQGQVADLQRKVGALETGSEDYGQLDAQDVLLKVSVLVVVDGSEISSLSVHLLFYSLPSPAQGPCTTHLTTQHLFWLWRLLSLETRPG